MFWFLVPQPLCIIQAGFSLSVSHLGLFSLYMHTFRYTARAHARTRAQTTYGSWI